MNVKPKSSFDQIASKLTYWKRIVKRARTNQELREASKAIEELDKIVRANSIL